MLLFWLGSCHVIPAPKYVGQSGTCGCDEMLHLRLFKPKWLTFTSIIIRFPAHFSNKFISISKHEHSMVIHIASLMRVNLHNTGKYPQNTYNKAIRDGRPRPPRHQCVCQISSWSVEKWLNYDVGYMVTAKNGIYRNFIWGVRTSTPVDLGNYNA